MPKRSDQPSASHPVRICSEAAFAQIAGTYSLPASSGNTVRHRRNRDDRRLNRTLSTVVLTRMSTDPATLGYIERRVAEGKTSRQIFRTLTAAHPARHSAAGRSTSVS